MSVPAKKANSIPFGPAAFDGAEEKKSSKAKWILGVLVGSFLLVQAGLTWYWSIEPAKFDVVEQALKRSGIEDQKQLVKGYIFANTLAGIGDTLLGKGGGYLSNDVIPPSILMDNMLNWEFGALVMLRDASQALRNDFARGRSQSKENLDLSRAEPAFNLANDSWMLPSSETVYQKGVGHLLKYMQDLQQGTPGVVFFSRADNLNLYLQVVEKRLGSYSTRLSASSAQKIPSGKKAGQPTARTPWLEVDDVFFEARGAMWALLQIFYAIEIEFDKTLRDKTAIDKMTDIIKELEAAQGALLSPVVLNGNGFGVFANYSLTMANHITRANAATLDLRSLMVLG